ncbi:sulfatase [Persicobacter psychrovividus]|uniref:N-acetylglucosamine-6-sulfatase n=1 Tax=Persicobacter psychrovividus TaxID=387638 RepID=A0ABN6LJE9_9BACT|nr:N-acetylglucosamine-6-sulfatase [Persicobacter psychrovividus]
MKGLFRGLILVALSGLGSTLVNAQKNEAPNIIFIMSDDHAYQAISAYGHGLNQTPNIDRIADEGVIFNSATVTNSICAPSRAVMLTGKHSFRNGKVDNHQEFDWNQDNFVKQLQENNYATALLGKIHLDGTPQGFDHYAVLPAQGNYYNPDFIINGDTTQIEGYVTDITTDMVIDWLDDRNTDKPFCVLYHQKAPHREWLPAERHYKKYTKRTFKEPTTLFANNEGRGTAAQTAEMNILSHMNWAGDSKISPEALEAMGIDENSDWGIEAWEKNLGRMNKQQRASWDATYQPIIEDFKSKYPTMSKEQLTKWRYQRYMQDYLACIASVDEGVGRVLDYLDQNNLAENTIVVYTSDQGFYLGENGWFDKRFMYEQSLRTPLLMRYPKEVEAGQKSDALVQNLDFAPTFLDYAGINIPTDIQGKSFRKVLNQEDENFRDAVYYTYYEYPSIHMVKRHYGIRTHRYKLIHFYYDVDQWELYDLSADPDEQTNVYNSPEYAEIKEQLHQQLTDLRKEYGDSDQLQQEHLDRYINTVKETMSGL